MTKILRDSIQTDCTIKGNTWRIIEAEVKLTQMIEPNYVDINGMVPTSEVSTSSSDIENLIGEDFSLEVDTQIKTNRNSKEEVTLFKGKVANISAIGNNRYEAMVYDPSQQPLAGLISNQQNQEDDEEDDETSSPESSVGSLINRELNLLESNEISLAEYRENNPDENDITFTDTVYTKRASDIIDKIVRNVSSLKEDNVDNQLLTGGRVYNNGTIEGAYDRIVAFDNHKPKVKTVIKRIEEDCECEFWFDRKGILHIGVPDPTVYNLELIKEAADGFTTPPYRSIRVIGKSIGNRQPSIEGNNDTNTLGAAYSGKKLTVERYLDLKNISGGKAEPKELEDGENIEQYAPIFTYRNDSITTVEQAKSAANKILTDIGKQYAEGNVTVVGLPDIEPFDVIKMPQDDDQSKDNFQHDKPMGGARYGVYAVTHRLNPDDGFITKIEVTAPVWSASNSGSVLSESDRELVTSLDELRNLISEVRDEIPAGTCRNILFDMDDTAEKASMFASNSSPKQVTPKINELDSQLSDLRECRSDIVEYRNVGTEEDPRIVETGLEINKKIQEGGALQEKIDETRNKANNAIKATEDVDSSATLQGKISTDRYNFNAQTIDSSADLTSEISGDSGGGSVENVEDTEDTEDDESDDDRALSGSEGEIDTTYWFTNEGDQNPY